MFARISDEAARRFPHRPAVVAPDGVLTYGELADYSIRLAHGLADLGISRGDVVLLALHSGCDWLVAALATARVGAAFAGLSPVLSTDERSAIARMVRPDLILAAPNQVDGMPLRRPVSVIDPGSRGSALWPKPDFESAGPGSADPGSADPGSAGPRDAGTWTPVTIATSSAESTAPPPDSDNPAVICFTSGTTGTPKAAMYTEAQLSAIQTIDLGPDAESIWDGGSPMLASTQFAHVGMSTKFPWYIRRGMTLHVMDRWRADDALRLVARHHMPAIGAIAPQLALMLRSPLMDELDLSSVRMLIAGGAASPAPLVREARERFGAAYSIRYSSTESGGVGLATDASTNDESEWSTVGGPREGIEVRIADSADEEVPDGEEGELQLRSGAIMHSYWNDPVATERALTTDRWLRTGDLARLDGQGRVVLVGRKSDMYIRGGYNVFPAEVEAVLLEHPAVADVVVTPQRDDVMGETGVALVVPVSGSVPTLADLREFASDRLARYKLPERLLVIERVPLSAAQKIDRRAAASLLADHLQADPK